MSIEARTVGPGVATDPHDCAGCGGDKGAPLAGVVSIHRPHDSLGFSFALCEECGRDTANAIGFLCIREGGWSKIEPRKKRTSR
jgi:hypothetical protein